MAEKGLSVVKACAAVDLSRSAWYRKPQDKLERDKEVIDALQSLVEKRPRWGFYLCYRGCEWMGINGTTSVYTGFTGSLA